MAKVSIIGAGNVGSNTAFFIAETGTCDVALYDIKEGLATGMALDMMEAAPIRRYRSSLKGIEDIDSTSGSDVVFITAGKSRQQDMKREELLEVNAGIIVDLAKKLVEITPDSIFILATEPVDMITTLFVETSGIPINRVMGIGGCLDSTRFRYLIARELDVSMENVSAMIVGRHSDSMIALPNYTDVSGVPVRQLIPDERIAELVDLTRKSGDLIVSMAQRASAYYAPSAAAAELIDSIIRDLRRIFSVSRVLDGEYGLNGMAISLPAVIGRSGIEKQLTPNLNAQEARIIVDSANEVRSILDRRSR